jgi:hypothetical protein
MTVRHEIVESPSETGARSRKAGQPPAWEFRRGCAPFGDRKGDRLLFNTAYRCLGPLKSSLSPFLLSLHSPKWSILQRLPQSSAPNILKRGAFLGGHSILLTALSCGLCIRPASQALQNYDENRSSLHTNREQQNLVGHGVTDLTESALPNATPIKRIVRPKIRIHHTSSPY